MNDKISDIVKTARIKKGLSQMDLAKAVGVSQSTIHNVEKGHGASDKVVRTILEFLELPDDFTSSRIQDAPPISTYRVSAFSAIHGNSYDIAVINSQINSGDLMSLSSTNGQNSSTRILVADNAGHGPEVGHKSFALNYGWKILNKCISDSVFTPKIAANILLSSTDKYWDGEPSLTIIQVLANSLFIENIGMPESWLFKKDSSGKFQRIAIDNSWSGQIPTSAYDLAFTFSDGFIETFESFTKQTLSIEFMEVLNVFDGAAATVATNLLNRLTKFKDLMPEDDMIAMIIAKRG